MKLSDLPEGTVVEFPVEGHYEKSDTHWMHMYGHCPDCDADDVFTHEEAEEKFGEFFSIISMPFSVVWQLAIMLAEEYKDYNDGKEPTFEEIIKDAIDEVAERTELQKRMEEDKRDN